MAVVITWAILQAKKKKLLRKEARDFKVGEDDSNSESESDKSSRRSRIRVASANELSVEENGDRKLNEGGPRRRFTMPVFRRDTEKGPMARSSRRQNTFNTV